MSRISFISTAFCCLPEEYQGSHAEEEPLDLLYAIAAASPYSECRFIDLTSDPDLEWLSTSNAVVVSTTNSYLQWNNHPLGLANFRRTWSAIHSSSLRSDVKTYVFGPHVPAHREDILAMGADHVLIGEAELAIALIASGIKVASPTSPIVVDDLDLLPRPAWDVSGLQRNYSAHNRVGGGLGHLYEASRGCPFQCSFCNTITHRRSYRYKSVSKIRGDLEWLAMNSANRFVYFIDESFGFKRAWADDVLQALKAIPLEYGCQNNLAYCTREKLDNMRAAGFTSVEFGLESADKAVLRNVGKWNPLDKSAELLRHAIEIGLNPLLFLQVGLPGETAESLRATVDWLAGVEGVRLSVALPTPYLGTELYHRGMSEGAIPTDARPDDLYHYSGTIGHDLRLDRDFSHCFLSRYGPNWTANNQTLEVFHHDLMRLLRNPMTASGSQ